MSFDVQGQGAAPARSCPFCGAAAPGRACGACGRDTMAPRRPCASCGRMVPTAEPRCWSCGAEYRSDMWWKVPLIVLLFLLAFVVSIVLAVLK